MYCTRDCSLIAVGLAASLFAFGQPQPSNDLGGCPIFPYDSIWNVPIDKMPLDPNSSNYLINGGLDQPLHPDFGSGLYNGGPIGIPFVAVPGSQPKVTLSFTYADESDHGPYPIPPDVPIEGGPNSTGDRHALVIDRDNCVLYELYNASPNSDGTWRASSGAIFDLQCSCLRPATWTSADAAGLPIFPGLVRYDEAISGTIPHAIRMTLPSTREAYIWPARHFASKIADLDYPPMGQRFRLRADFDLSGFSLINQAILQALKTYGMILADNGSSWFISGVPDDRWNNDDLAHLNNVHGSDFEAVDVSSLMISADSSRANLAADPSIPSIRPRRPR